jgi:TRAP-type transport system periplasmic protein
MTRKAILFLMVLALGAAILGAAPVQTQAATVQLTYSNFFPPTHFNAILGESWAKEIEKRTNGQGQIHPLPRRRFAQGSRNL